MNPQFMPLDLQHRPPVYDSKTILECLDTTPLMTGIYVATSDLPVHQIVCKLIFGNDFERRRHKTF